MVTSCDDDRPADGERRVDQRLWFVPYVALAVSTTLVVVQDGAASARPLSGTLAVVAVTAGWLLWMVTLHPRWAYRGALMAVFFVGLLALTAALIWRDPLFGFFAWTGYLFLSRLRGRWRLAGAAGVALLTAASQVGGFAVVADPDNLPVVAVFAAFNVGIGCAMTFLAMLSDRQATRRRRTIVELAQTNEKLAQTNDELAETNEKLARAMAENAGLHAQLLVQAREAGVLDERQRLAGEIHDVLAQGLTGIVTQLEAADQAADRPADRRRHLHTATRLARDSLAEARRSVQALSPRPLAAGALPEALREVLDDWSALNRVTAELITTGTVRPLVPDIETTLLRTAQEALANVTRHAGAGRVALTLSYMEDLVTLDVRDDGAGFDPSTPRPSNAHGGYGLAVMRERVQRVAGSLEVESEPGAGTAVSACVPAIGNGSPA